MKEGQRLWTREETILAINLYCKIPFGQMHNRNADVKKLAALIDRSPSSVARKLGNFASLDPKLKERGVMGLPNISKLDKQIWQEYMNNWDAEFFEGETLLAQKKGSTIIEENEIDLSDLPPLKGKERERVVKVRVNQCIFRKIVLSNYNNQCCITGVNMPELLVASHILPWSQDKENQLNPKNGLSLNALHDKAFDRHLITVTDDLRIKISSSFYEHKHLDSIRQNFIEYDGKPIIMPNKFDPDLNFLKYHNEKFKG